MNRWYSVKVASDDTPAGIVRALASSVDDARLQVEAKGYQVVTITKMPFTWTAAEYSEEHKVSVVTARNRLNALVREGKAMVTHGMIERRSAKRGARNRQAPVYGNIWIILETEEKAQ